MSLCDAFSRPKQELFASFQVLCVPPEQGNIPGRQFCPGSLVLVVLEEISETQDTDMCFGPLVGPSPHKSYVRFLPHDPEVDSKK